MVVYRIRLKPLSGGWCGVFLPILLNRQRTKPKHQNLHRHNNSTNLTQMGSLTRKIKQTKVIRSSTSQTEIRRWVRRRLWWHTQRRRWWWLYSTQMMEPIVVMLVITQMNSEPTFFNQNMGSING